MVLDDGGFEVLELVLGQPRWEGEEVAGRVAIVFGFLLGHGAGGLASLHCAGRRETRGRYISHEKGDFEAWLGVFSKFD